MVGLVDRVMACLVCGHRSASPERLYVRKPRDEGRGYKSVGWICPHCAEPRPVWVRPNRPRYVGPLPEPVPEKAPVVRECRECGFPVPDERVDGYCSDFCRHLRYDFDPFVCQVCGSPVPDEPPVDPMRSNWPFSPGYCSFECQDLAYSSRFNRR